MSSFVDSLPEESRESATGKKAGWKQRIREEMISYWITVLYLALFFGVFNTYRRLILAHYEISYLNYGVALIEALVLAKVILIGDLLRLGWSMNNRPLIFPTLTRSVVFTIFVAAFKFLEETVKGLIRHQSWTDGFQQFTGTAKYQYLASLLVVFFTFIPFFALKELNRVIGKGKIWRLFFSARGSAESSPKTDSISAPRITPSQSPNPQP
jgi:hypothetical protein